MKRGALYLLVLCSIHFWGYLNIPKSVLRLAEVLALLVMFYSFINVAYEKGLRFKGAIIIFMLGTIFNIFSAYFNHNQSIKDTLINFFPYYFILFYFYLHEQKFSRKDIENLIIVFALIYTIIYIFQERMYPNRYFAGAMYRDRGTIRLRIEGGGFLMLAYFLFLNRYLMERKIIHIILAMIFFFILLKSGFRTLSISAVLLSGIVFLKLVKYSAANYFLIIVAVILFVGMLQFEPTARIINGMINATEEQQAEQERGETNIRILQYDYFTEVYPQNFSYYIFGGGLPGAFGEYTHYMRYLEAQFGFYWVDLGLLGFYYVVGLITLIGLLGYAIRAIFMKLPPHSLYLNMYFAYLILTSLITAEIYRIGLFSVEAITLYLIDLARNEKLQINPVEKVEM